MVPPGSRNVTKDSLQIGVSHRSEGPGGSVAPGASRGIQTSSSVKEVDAERGDGLR